MFLCATCALLLWLRQMPGHSTVLNNSWALLSLAVSSVSSPLMSVRSIMNISRPWRRLLCRLDWTAQKVFKNVLHWRLGMKSDYMLYSFFFYLFGLGNGGFRNPTDRVEPRVVASVIITSIEKVEIAVGTFLHSWGALVGCWRFMTTLSVSGS